MVDVQAGKPLDIYVEYTNTPPPDATQTDMSQPGLMLGVVSIPLNFAVFTRLTPTFYSVWVVP